MSLHSKHIGNNLVYYAGHLKRWVDAIGAGVIKVGNDSIQKWTADHWTETDIAGTNTVTVVNGQGGSILLTCGGTENNGVSIQLKGEPFMLTADDPAYFGCKFHALDVDQSDIMIGLCITDTTPFAGLSDGVYFLSADASAAMTFVTELNNSATSTTGATLSDNDETFVEFYWNGTSLEGFIDGTSLGIVTTTLPTDEALTPTIAILTGEGTANTMTITYLNAIQVQSDK